MMLKILLDEKKVIPNSGSTLATNSLTTVTEFNWGGTRFNSVWIECMKSIKNRLEEASPYSGTTKSWQNQ